MFGRGRKRRRGAERREIVTIITIDDHSLSEEGEGGDRLGDREVPPGEGQPHSLSHSVSPGEGQRHSLSQK